MGKFDGILICTDLDGTLYKNDKTVSPENREAIEYFKREGGAFTFITGRLPYYSVDAYNAARPNVPFGCGNGGGVYDGAVGKYVWKCIISREVLDLVECIDRSFPTVGIQVCTFDRTYFAKECSIMPHFRARTGLPNLVMNYREVEEPIAKILFVTDSEEDMTGVEKTLRVHPLGYKFDFIRSERTLFEILPKGVDKGLLLSKIVEYLRLDMKKTIAVGDYYNDVPMLRAARVGIAVSNACPVARDAADFITVSNEENAIAAVIRDLESGRLGI